MKFGIRWCNPGTGTWTQQDTLDAPLDPANANRYLYAGGDPINGLDPTGGSVASSFACDFGSTGLGVAGLAVEAAGVTGVFLGIGCIFYDAHETDPTLYARNPEELVATAGGY